jgi:eukaryotic-like serine/threonine-protein kinase
MAKTATTGTCTSCGAPLSGEARQGFCPKCLFLQAGAGVLAAIHEPSAEDEETMDTGQSSVVGGQGPAVSGQKAAVRGQRSEGGGQAPQVTSGVSAIEAGKSSAGNGLGDYELLEVIGRGGMGLVYRARQRSLDRVVAIKMTAFGPGSSPELVKRFRAEAVAAAALQHPNIVAIHEVGIHEGRHFFVMDYVEGQSLAQLVGNRPLPAQRAAGYLKTIAEVVHYAHERGILHRDLKPSNVLIDGQDRPRVVDFGLARRLEGDSELTVTGQVLGSPHYLPPEQATGRRGRVSRRTDVYGLGATLYHLLTGRPPCQAESLAETLDLVLHNEPVAPRLLNPGLPRDLETICLKCLEKEPVKRYPTAQAVADELGRFLEGQPILARPVGAAGKAWRWCRRNPRLATAVGVAGLSLVVGVAGISWQWRRAEVQRARAVKGELSAQRRAYISEVNSAQQALEANNAGRALQLLNWQRPPETTAGRQQAAAVDFRNWEWRYLWQDCQTEAEAVIGRLPNPIRSLQVSAPEGQWLVAGSGGGGVKLWNLASGEETILAPERGVSAHATFSPDALRLLFCDQTEEFKGTIGVWDLEARKRLPPITDERPVGPMAFSPDGRWFGYGVAVRLRGPQGGRLGKAIVLRAWPGLKNINEVSTLSPIKGVDHANDWVFTPDSRSVVYGESQSDRRIGLCDLLPGSKPSLFAGHSEAVTALAVSPSSPVLATGAGYTNRNIKLWQIPSFRPLGELSGHKGWIMALAFSPDGQTLASASADNTIRLWDVAAREARHVFSGLSSGVSRLCFTPDGQKLFSGGTDGMVCRWPAQPPQPAPRPIRWRNEIGLEAVTVDSDATHFAGLSKGGVYVGGEPAGSPPRQIAELGTNNTCLRFSPDGRRLLVGTASGAVQVWYFGDEQPLRCLRGSATNPTEGVWQDTQGQILVAVHREKKVQLNLPVQVVVWNARTWEPQRSWTLTNVQNGCEVSPDGRWLASAFLRRPLRLASLTDPSCVRTTPCPGQSGSLAFSPDGKLLATANVEGVVRIWAMPTLRKVTEVQARSQALFGVCFSPDGLRALTAGEGAEAVRLWDVETWQELITLPLEGERLSQIFFSADGRQLAASSSRGDLFLWQAPSFAEIEAKEKEARTQ